MIEAQSSQKDAGLEHAEMHWAIGEEILELGSVEPFLMVRTRPLVAADILEKLYGLRDTEDFI